MVPTAAVVGGSQVRRKAVYQRIPASAPDLFGRVWGWPHDVNGWDSLQGLHDDTWDDLGVVVTPSIPQVKKPPIWGYTMDLIEPFPCHWTLDLAHVDLSLGKGLHRALARYDVFSKTYLALGQMCE